MDRHNVTQRISQYLQENHISVEQVERDLGMERGRLSCASGMKRRNFLNCAIILMSRLRASEVNTEE